MMSTLLCVALAFADEPVVPDPAPDEGTPVTVPEAPSAAVRGFGVKKLVEIKRSPYHEQHAFIIGIDDYVDTTLNLQYAVSDAEGIESALGDRFEFATVNVLVNEDATRANVLAALDSYRDLDPEDALFIFWAGHGTQEETTDGESIGYLVPHDGSFARDRLLIDNISMSQLKDVIGKRIPAKHKFMVVDACYGGILATRDAMRPDVDEAYIAAATSEPAFQILTAGRADQPVLDGGPGGHSVFTGRFIEALDNIGSFNTASMLHATVAPQVRQDAFDRGERVQTPVFANVLGLGDFVWIPKDVIDEDDRVKAATALRGRMKRVGAGGVCTLPWTPDRHEVVSARLGASEDALLKALDVRDQAAADAEASWMRGLGTVLDEASCP